MTRTVLIVLALIASTAAVAGGPPVGRKPILSVYGDANIRNCKAFDTAWKTIPEFRAALQARYDVRFPQTHGPIGYRCYPTFVVEGTEPLCGFRGVDVLLMELGITPPAGSRSDASTAAELNDVKASINAAVEVAAGVRGELAELKAQAKTHAEEIDAIKIESTAFRDRTGKGWQRFDELQQALARETASKAAIDRRIDELERRPAIVAAQPPAPPLAPAEPPAKATGPRKREWVWNIFGIVLPAAQAAGVLATGGVGGIALAVVPMIISGIARRRAAKSRASDLPPVAGTEPRPPATRVVPETRFTPIVTDRFAEAYAWARAEYGKRYPGSADTLDSFDGMLRQHVDSRSPRC